MKLQNIKKITTLILLLVFVLNSITVYAIEKPTYVDWMRELYEYDETVTDEEIVKEKGFEDETGRVFFKNPKTLTYDLFTGTKEVIASIIGFNTKHKARRIDLSNINFTENVSNIVRYYQIDYPNVMYGRGGTIASSACGAVSFAMIVDSLTDANMGVIDMCQWAVDNGFRCEGAGTYQAIMTKGAAMFGITGREVSAFNLQELVDELSAGHPVVALGVDSEKRLFTGCGHYLVLAGIASDGTIIVNDPNSKTKVSTTLDYLAANGKRYWAFTTPTMQ